MGSFKSEWENVYKGAAQGYLMGVQYYNMFTNNLLFIIEDDIAVYNCADNIFLCSGYDYESVKKTSSIQRKQCVHVD